ncbi:MULTISPECIES: helix-turn-helix domain-containing protein [Paenibacillus]|uniref:helix-turn-helix domain-containing protein n=1 Tax=Paenibacillus TaxID=44249 RepID=UPI0022B8E360|nr:helix-turn-helix domain-containing protein [Paenibacillus caseinilyticus]MCZ8519831.1 helix-turn-helix domain-containing protein [Paenibacillus caseinilyticus]
MVKMAERELKEKLNQLELKAKETGQGVTVALTAEELHTLIQNLGKARAKRVGPSKSARLIPKEDDGCYSVAEVAKRFNYSEQAIYKWIHTGKIKAHKVPFSKKGYRIPKDQFKERISLRDKILQSRKQLIGDAVVEFDDPSGSRE